MAAYILPPFSGLKKKDMKEKCEEVLYASVLEKKNRKNHKVPPAEDNYRSHEMASLAVWTNA